MDSLAAMLELGCLLGAIITGTFADHLTRRQAIVLACSTCVPARRSNDAFEYLRTLNLLVVFSIGSTFQFAAQTLSQIVFGRAVGGLGVGALR